MPTTITVTEVTPAATSSHEDVDITSLVGADAGNVAVVHLRVYNTSASPASVGIRKNGSINDLYTPWAANTWDGVTIGVDSADVFEARVSSTVMKIYMWGYSTNDEAEALTNGISFAGDLTEATWSTVTAHLASFTNTPQAIFGTCQSTGFSYGDIGARPTGSTNIVTQVGPRTGDRGWYPFSMVTNSSGEFDFYSANASERLFKIDAILYAGVTANTNETLYDVHSSANAATWAASTVTGSVNTGDPFTFAHIYSVGALSNDQGLRPGGSSLDQRGAVFTARQHYDFLPMTATDSIEIYAFDGGQGDPRVATGIYGSAAATPGAPPATTFVPRHLTTLGVGR